MAVGSQLETINGTAVSAAERVSVSMKNLAGFFGRNQKDMDVVEQEELIRELGDIVRRGWIGPRLPKTFALMKQELLEMENDPVSVRAIRLHTILKSDERTISQFIKALFSPPAEKKRIVNTDAYDRLEKQQSLIAYMQEQLEELKQAQSAAAAPKEKKPKIQNKEEITLSRQTGEAYEELLERVGMNLIMNSEKVVAGEQERTRKRNPDGLRNAVMRITEAFGAGDRELIEKLQSLVDENYETE